MTTGCAFCGHSFAQHGTQLGHPCKSCRADGGGMWCHGFLRDWSNRFEVQRILEAKEKFLRETSEKHP
jgi:hypothetical protein